MIRYQKNIRYSKWNEAQNKKLKERLENKLVKAIKAKDYVKKLLSNCKTWEGPCCTSPAELQQVMKGNPEKQETIVRTELAFYSHTHKPQKIARPDLFRLNNIAHEERLINLAILHIR